MSTISADYSNLPTSALIALARLILKRARLGSLPVASREQAIRIIRGVKPAPPRRLPLFNVKPCVAECPVCHKPMPLGTPCDSLGRMHIECQEVSNVRPQT